MIILQLCCIKVSLPYVKRKSKPLLNHPCITVVLPYEMLSDSRGIIFHKKTNVF